MRNLDELKRLITQGQARKADAHAHCMKCREESARLAEEAVTSKKANVLLQEVATHVQHDLERAVETGVQSCLDMLFPGYSFSVSFVPRRGKTEADFKICKNGEAFDPKYSNGGGVLDTISFALRAGCLHLANKRPVFLLDEPFGHLTWPQASLSNLASHVILPTEDWVRTELGGLPLPRGRGWRL